MLAASIVFYSWGAPRFIFAILLTTALDFLFVAQLHRAGSVASRKAWLSLTVLSNLGMLFYFKYAGFFMDNLAGIAEPLGFQTNLIRVVLPIGISFYTFESITYAVDVYRRVHAPLDRFSEYLLYILFFPKLIAGPIVRYHEIADQMGAAHREAGALLWLGGFIRFTIGLLKKVVLANNIGIVAEQVFSMAPGQLNTGLAWVGAVSYAFQIYFDFSGYSDMAIGLAQVFGFRLPENFDQPYTSASVTEFWRRWHMSLGRWMKNYLYLPLGGNRRGRARTYFNLWLVFLVSGLWHGASWNFVVWGAYHGFFLVMERLLPERYHSGAHPLRCSLTFVIVTIGWVFFRTNTLQDAWHYIGTMFGARSGEFVFVFSPHYVFYLLLCFLFSGFRFLPGGVALEAAIYQPQLKPARVPAITAICCIGFFLCICSLATFEFNPFIYFRF